MIGAEADEVGDRAAHALRIRPCAASAKLDATTCWKIAPSPAMPVAMPTWRNVELMPDAMPARCGSTTPTAAVASAGLVEADAAAGDEEARQQRRPVVARLEAAHQQQPDPDEREAAAEEPADADALGELAGDRRDEEREQRHGQEAQAGLERRVAEDVLDVERQVQEHREHRRRQHEGGDRGAVERRLAEQREVEHRVLAAALDDHEGDEQDQRGGEAGDDQRAVPALRVAADEPEDQREEGAGERDQAGPVDPPAARRVRLLHLREREQDRRRSRSAR